MLSAPGGGDLVFLIQRQERHKYLGAYLDLVEEGQHPRGSPESISFPRLSVRVASGSAPRAAIRPGQSRDLGSLLAAPGVVRGVALCAAALPSDRLPTSATIASREWKSPSRPCFLTTSP